MTMFALSADVVKKITILCNMNIGGDLNTHNILWCPIDLPKFPIKDFTIDTASEWIDWKFSKLTEHRNSPYDVSILQEEIIKNFPELVKWFALFPHKTIRNIKFNIQNNKVNPHIDFTNPSRNMELYNNNSENEPCGYRVLISGKRANSLYIVNNEKKIYTVMPDDTDVYVLGHTCTMHGVDQEEGRKTLFLHFEIDPSRHFSLLKRSIEKYSKFAIFDL
jgi:hypothetical protein